MRLRKLAAGILSLAMAVSLLPASAFAADTNTDTYVMMNIPYAQFYKADVNNSVDVDAFTSATQNKTRTGSLAGGSYHVDPKGTDITGVTFPVKTTESALEQLKKTHTDAKVVTDSDSVSIEVTNRRKTTTTEYKGVEALFENPSYSYYVLSETPSYYKEMTVTDGTVSFGSVQGTEQEIKDVTVELNMATTYGDYEIDLDGLLKDADKGTGYLDTSKDKVYGVVIETQEGDSYGLRHMENIWRAYELSWCVGYMQSVHGCPTSSAHYAKSNGQTINKITYYTSKGIYVINTSVKLPKLSVDLTALKSAASAGRMKESDYTADSWKAFQTELTKGQALLENDAIASLTQAQVDAQTTALTTAKNNLVKIKDLLTDAVASAKKLKESDYTADSWKAFQAALKTAEAALANTETSPTAEQLDTFNKAVSALVKKPATTTLKKGAKVTDKASKAAYKVTGASTVEYTKPSSKKATSASVPATIKANGKTYKVTSIAAKAFYKNTKLKKVTIGSNIKKIGKQAFFGCKNLKKITIKTKSLKKSTVGSKAFKGINKKATIKVPKKQKKAYKKILKAKGIGSKVKVK